MGCGSGVYMRQALVAGAGEVVGLDPAKRMLEHTKMRLETSGISGDSELVLGSFPGCCPKEKFDAIGDRAIEVSRKSGSCK